MKESLNLTVLEWVAQTCWPVGNFPSMGLISVYVRKLESGENTWWVAPGSRIQEVTLCGWTGLKAEQQVFKEEEGCVEGEVIGRIWLMWEEGAQSAWVDYFIKDIKAWYCWGV